MDFADEGIRSVMDLGDDLVESFSLGDNDVSSNISPLDSARQKVMKLLCMYDWRAVALVIVSDGIPMIVV